MLNRHKGTAGRGNFFICFTATPVCFCEEMFSSEELQEEQTTTILLLSLKPHTAEMLCVLIKHISNYLFIFYEKHNLSQKDQMMNLCSNGHKDT